MSSWAMILSRLLGRCLSTHSIVAGVWIGRGGERKKPMAGKPDVYYLVVVVVEAGGRDRTGPMKPNTRFFFYYYFEILNYILQFASNKSNIAD